MVEPQANRNPGETAMPRSDSQLRLVRPPQVLPDPDAEPSDDSPTIISKNALVPQHAIQATPPPDLMSGNLRGRTLAHFELLDPIGVGGMAAVIRARDKQLDRTVALKILPPDMANDVENIRRFHQEARAAAKLDHENIARVFFCGEDQRLHFIAFEFVEGDNLKTILERRRRIPVPEAVRYMLQIAAGLEHASSRGVVHRDIKPSNIIISTNGRAKLVDMGLARNMGPQTDNLTQSGVTLGTFDYISPEQALEPRDADTRSDLYSLGCTFYHMLTGHPPVPEGTAAKKLHHHQHVAPVDPRQLNPSIPDEVAAILARMMAKDPKDRYQRPVHLVQHLMQVAQKVGAADDLPEGGLFVDAPLPSEPRQRPVVLFLAATLGLAIILLVLSVIGPGVSPPPLKPSAGSLAKGPDKANGAKHPVGPSQTPRASPFEKLKEDLANPDSKTIKLASHLFDVPESLVFDGPGRDVTIESKDAADPRTIRMKYTGQGDQWAGIWVKGGSIRFRNIRFELQATESSSESSVAMLGLTGGAKVTFEGCTFSQDGQSVSIDRRPGFLAKESRKIVPFASVALYNPESDVFAVPQVGFQNCYFQRGQVAVAIVGIAKCWARQCAFGEHAALFHVRGDGKEYDSKIFLQNCSSFLVRGPAFRFDDLGCCELQMEDSMISCPFAFNVNEADRPNLIHQIGALRPAVKFLGKGNCFHNLNYLWENESGSPSSIAKLADFRTEIEKNGGSDTGSYQIAGLNDPYPWAHQASPHKLAPHEGFQLKDDLPLFREHGPVGVHAVLGFALKMPVRQPEAAPIARKDKQKIVDPDAGEVPPPNTFQTVEQALAFAKPGDEILIKHGKNRRVEIPPQRLLEKPDVHLTFKPFENHQPILTLAETSQSDAAMFRLHDGTLRFENLELELEADQAGFSSLRLVSIEGNGLCSFHRCILTLKERSKKGDVVPMSVVNVIRPGPGMLSMDMGVPRPEAPRVHFQDCFIRGQGEVLVVGDSLAVKGTRPVRLKIENALLALAGNGFQFFGGMKEEAETTIELKQVSVFLTDSLLHFRAGKKNPVLTRMDAESSLFVGLTPDKHIVDIADAESRMLDSIMKWSGRRNAYSGYESFKLDWETWRSPEVESRFVTVKSAMLPAVFSRAMPEQFKVTDNNGQPLPGADLDRLQRLAVPPEPSGDD